MIIMGCSNKNQIVEYWPTNGWQKSTPEKMGMDSEKLVKILDKIESSSIDSVTIIRNGYLVLDAYNYPYQPGRLHAILSCTKSITSSLIGIAIDQKFIQGVETPILGFFPNEMIHVNPDEKKHITLHHALTMTTGIDFQDSHLYRWKNLKKLYQTKNWENFVLNQPMKHAPGVNYEYSNITSFLLSAILQTATEKKVSEFADEYFFGKLGIDHYIWNEHSSGINFGYGSIRMNNLDLAKIGYLYLNNGRWENEQIISNQWIKESTSSHVKNIKNGCGDVYDYGYQWWVKTENLLSAQGKGGQYIIIDKKNNLVVVFTSSFPDRFGCKPEKLFSTHIVPSIISNAEIVENPAALKALQEKTQALSGSLTVEPEAVPIPIWLNEYNGKEFTYKQKVFRTEKIIFNADIENNVLSLTSIDSNNTPTKIQAGLNGRYHYNNIRPDLLIASKAEIIDNRILWENAMPELGWRAKYTYQFKDDTIEVEVTDLIGSVISTQGFMHE